MKTEKDEKTSKKFVCLFCGKSYSCKYYLKKHKQSTHQITELKCRICSSNFLSLSARQNHEKTQHSVIVSDNNCVWSCLECKKNFTRRFHLIRHFRDVHTDEYFECECGKKFQTRSGIHLHMKSHLGAPRTFPKLVCDHCGLIFAIRKRLIQHIFSYHLNENKRTSFICAICIPQFSTGKKRLILQHYKQHGLKIESESHEFSNAEKFENWKMCLEEQMKCSYITRNTYYGVKKKSILFQCQRSGMYKTKGKGKRLIRLIGTEKINAYCPSEIQVQIDYETGKHDVLFLKQHVGHAEGVEFMQGYKHLKKKLEETIASEALKINSFSEIVCCDSKLYGKSKYRDEALKGIFASENVQVWISENEDWILYYKAIGCRSEEYPELKETHFMLIMMNNYQEKYLRDYGNDIIMVDRTQGLTICGLELSAVMVLDDLRQGILSSLMLSNCRKEKALEIFFAEIRKRVGILKPKILISDVDLKYLSAWTKIHKTPEKYLYCTWQVRKAWKNELSIMKGSLESKIRVRDLLHNIQTEINPILFHQKLDEFLKTDSRHLVNFVSYFKKKYASTYTAWAYYCRQYADVNTSNFLQKFLKNVIMKYSIYAKIEDLHKAVIILAQILKNLLCLHLIGAKKGNLTTKIKTLRIMHNSSLSEKHREEFIVRLDDKKWYVPTSRYRAKDLTFDDMYLIEQAMDTCCCKIRCRPCNACLHMYKCPCVSNSIEGHMCKHIHVLCSWRNAQNERYSEANSDDEICSISVEEKYLDGM